MLAAFRHRRQVVILRHCTWHPSSVVSDARSGIPSQLYARAGRAARPWASTTAAMPIRSPPARRRASAACTLVRPGGPLISWRIRLASIRACSGRPARAHRNPAEHPAGQRGHRESRRLVADVGRSEQRISSRKRYTAGGRPGRPSLSGAGFRCARPSSTRSALAGARSAREASSAGQFRSRQHPGILQFLGHAGEIGHLDVSERQGRPDRRRGHCRAGQRAVNRRREPDSCRPRTSYRRWPGTALPARSRPRRRLA